MGVATEAATRIAAEIDVVDVADVEGLDVASARLARGQGRTRLCVGRVAEALISTSGHRELGFSSVASYAYERLGRSGAWLDESRRVARQMSGLPACRDALVRGDITWKMAALLGRHATVDDEAMMLAAARRSTVREMAGVLADCEAAREQAEEDEDGQRMCTVVRQVEVTTYWDAEVTRRIVAHLEGRDLGAEWIVPVLAEATSTLQNAGVDPLIESVAEACGRLLDERRRATAAREREEERAETRAEAAGRPMWESVEPGLSGVCDDEALPADSVALDAELRRLCQALDSADVWLGGALLRFRRANGHVQLGYGSFDQYARERLGLGRSAALAKIKLAAETDRLPEIGEAICAGQLDETAAMLVARVATHPTVEAWLARAKARTYKHLREEVELVEALPTAHAAHCGSAPVEDGECATCGLSDASRAPMPPSDAQVAKWAALERAMLSGEMVREALTEGGVRMCHKRGGGEGGRAGKRELRFRVPEDVFVEFRMMEVAFERAGLAGEFVALLCRTFWYVWAPTLGTSDKWEAIYRRDGYRCTCPVCLRRDVTLHHLTYRAAGGGDEAENVLSLCAWCHLEGEHAGRLKVRPPASRPRWELGRRGRAPVVVVEGRERVSRA